MITQMKKCMRVLTRSVNYTIPFIMVFFLLKTTVAALSPGDISGLNIERIGSLGELKSALNIMHTRFNGVQESQQLSFELQKTIAVKSGEYISRLVELSQKADLSQETQKEEFKSLFLNNGDLLRHMLIYNQTWVEDMLEEKLDRIQDKDAFFASPEWEQPQNLISIASYWLGWNNYYAALLYLAHDKTRTDLLEEAVSGFTRTLLDLKEQAIVCQSMFGRALCFKEREKYAKALQDIQSLMAKVSRDDSLYAQAGYERALISHLSGKNELAIKQIQELQEDVKPGVMPQQIKEKLRNLQTKIALSISEKKASAQGAHTKESYREAVQELKRIAEADAAQAGILYQYVLDHATHLADMSERELGSLGSMAIADWYFDRKQYELASERYRRLYSTPDLLIKNHLDDVCFRLAYCYAQKQQWQDALVCLETLFQKYPGSSFGGKAACLYYVVAAHAYQAQASESAYARYIKAAECYLKNCPDAQDKSEAHFQLGRYYQRQDRTKNALLEFSQVDSDSPHYAEARHASLRSHVDRLQSNVETLEALFRNGQGQSEKAVKLYQESLKQVEDHQKSLTKVNIPGDDKELEAHLAVLLARLYMHGSEPYARKALQILQGFEGRFSMKKQQELLYPMVRKLRLECCLQLSMRKEAEQEIAGITGQGTVDKKTWAFLNECADRYYIQAKEAQTKTDTDRAARHAETALVVYKRLADIAEKDASYKNLYEPIQMRFAELYTIDHKIAEAAAIYQKKLERDPTSADALYNLGIIYERGGRWEDAFNTWNKLTRGLKPGDSYWFEARYRTAQALSRLGKQKDACEVITVTQSLHPDLGDEELKGKFLKLRDEFCTKQDKPVTSNER